MNIQLHNQNKPFAGATLRKESVDKPPADGTFIMGNTNEIWKDIDICGGKYEASSLGNIRRKGRKSPLKLKIDKRNGYALARLYQNSRCTQKFAHRLIAISLIPNPGNKPSVNHINGIKTDNRVENLEWVTAKENAAHAIHILKSMKFHEGEKSHRALFNNKQVENIRSLALNGKTHTEISKIYKCDKSTISKIVLFKCYKITNPSV